MFATALRHRAPTGFATGFGGHGRPLRHRIGICGLSLALGAAALLTAGILAAPAASAANAAPAAERKGNYYYKVYIGGFHVVDLFVDMDLMPARYDVAVRLKTIGMIGDMFPWGMKSYSNGLIRDGKLVPASAGQQNNWRGSERFVDMKYAGGLATVERIRPKPDADDRDGVPEALRRGALDLSSAVLTVLTRMDADSRCNAKIPVFDGRRRFDLITRPDGTDILKASRYSPYAGPTVNCAVSIDRKAGFKKKASDSWSESTTEARVWMGKAFDDMPPVPVRLTFDTSFGALIAHLNRATYKSGQRQAVLSHGDVRRAGMP